MIDARDLCDVVNVIHQHGERRCGKRVRVVEFLHLRGEPLRVVFELRGERVALRFQTLAALD